MALTVVVAYDIREDARRARAAACIQQWGDRIQRSVYVCRLEADDLDDLLVRLRGIIDADTDALHAFRQCGTCWDALSIYGQAEVAAPTYYWSVW